MVNVVVDVVVVVDFVGECLVDFWLREVGGEELVDRGGGVAQGAAQLRDVVTVTWNKQK